MKVLIILALVSLSAAQQLYLSRSVAPYKVDRHGSSQITRQEDGVGNYVFGYQESHETGGSARQEQRDANGHVMGSYAITDADGRQRMVRYIADDYGFRASVLSNEPGVGSSSPAGVNMKSEEIPAPMVDTHSVMDHTDKIVKVGHGPLVARKLVASAPYTSVPLAGNGWYAPGVVRSMPVSGSFVKQSMPAAYW